MIRGIHLTEFKCFRDHLVALAPLTVLTGTNGSGKSTVIQSLLALRQSWEQRVLEERGLALNGDWVRLGTGRDVLNEAAEEEVIGIGIQAETETKWRFNYGSELEDLPGISPLPPVPELALFGDNFQYLCAERIGPRTSFAMADHAVHNLRLLGASGQYTAQFLAEFGSTAVAMPKLVRMEARADTLLMQASAWLGVIAAGARIYVEPHREMDVVQLQFAFDHPTLGETNRYRPTNVGFGLTYALPILVAVLSARRDALVIVENPEAHLHPQGQAEMGRMLALAAASGIQILVETHSDHVLNGIRVAVKQGELLATDTALHFFTWAREGKQPLHVVHSPRMNNDGRLDSWPAGFFDQWDRSLDQLLD
jgi:predicted ATPase